APWQAEWALRSADPFLDSELFRHIGKTDAQELTLADLKNAEKKLMRLDTDGDELITLPELVPNRGYPGFTMSAMQTSLDVPFLFTEPSEKGRRVLAARIIKQYGKDKKGKLSRTEIGWDRTLFDRLDANHDGHLQVEELMRWLDEPPDLELLVRVDGPANE